MRGPFDDSMMAAAAHVLMGGPVSRADLARDLLLSPGTLTRIVRPLIEDGLLIENQTGTSPSGMGRPTQLLEIPADRHFFIGINLTSTTVHAVLVDARCRIRDYRAVAFDDSSPRRIAVLVDDLIRESALLVPRDADLNGVGISLGGMLDGGRVVESRFLGWRNVDLPALVDLPAGLHALAVNDLEALTMLEQWFGLGAIAQDFVVLTVGAGIGHGLVHDRRRIESPAGGYGMTSHLPVAGASGMCQYGHIGCADGALTLPAVLSRARAGRSITSTDDRPGGIDDLIGLADEGDEACRSAIEEFSRTLATYLAEVTCAALVCDVVIDGEGVVLLDTPWAIPLDEGLGAFNNPNIPRLRIHRRSGGFDRWACGAATASIVQWLQERVAGARL